MLKNYHLYLSLILSILSVSVPTSRIFGAETTRYGTVVICAEDQTQDPASIKPQVIFPDENNNDWRLVADEACTGIDSHRFYFTIESNRKDAQPPLTEVIWPGVNISRVLDTKQPFEKTENGARFTPTRAKPRTDAFTEVAFGSVYLGVFHNWDVRRCGPYRDGDYPYAQIKAQLNYMLGALEVCRAYGWTATNKPDFVDHINLYGFETHFPNGHRDYPAHFHIMLGWNGWNNANVGHYLIDAQGNIVKNTYWVLHKDVENMHLPGYVSRYTDGDDREIFDTTILPDGSGLVFTKVGADREFLIRAGAKGSPESVEVCERTQGTEDAWKVMCEVVANDDAQHGVFVSDTKYSDGTVQHVEFKYDPDTGVRF